MAATCEVCGKGPSFGHSVARLGRNAMNRRVKGRSNRRWDANIQRVKVMVGGVTPKRIDVCTSCLKAGKVTP